VLKNYKEPLALEFFSAATGGNFAPAAVTDYTREAFVHLSSDTRITFDKALCTITDFNIFEDGIKKHIFDGNSTVLEVKFNEILPNTAKSLIPFVGQPEAVSKYCLCLDAFNKLRGKF
jgi:hypothetical protein